MQSSFGLVRQAFVTPIRDAMLREPVTIVRAPGGSGKLATARQASEGLNADAVLVVDGCGEASGYLAGFDELFAYVVARCEAAAPEVIQTYEQGLKRLFPTRHSPAFRAPKDLTNTSSRDERTRFYHHEYQTKLIHTFIEFLRDGMSALDCAVIVIVDRAHRLSRTALSTLEMLIRKLPKFHARLRLVLLCDEPGETCLRVRSRDVV
jgi:hypothetical protein